MALKREMILEVPMCCAEDVPAEGASPIAPQLRAELLRRVERDQHARNALVRAWPAIEAGDAERLRTVDDDNTRWLRQVLSTHGWPTVSLVGVDGAHAAWLLAQHADGDRDLQRACLAALANAVAHGEADPAHVAYLDDRIRVAEGKPQRYGTQYHSTGDGVALSTTEDPHRLDQRRAELGLEPFADYDARTRATYGHLARRKPEPTRRQQPEP